MFFSNNVVFKFIDWRVCEVFVCVCKVLSNGYGSEFCKYDRGIIYCVCIDRERNWVVEDNNCEVDLDCID